MRVHGIHHVTAITANAKDNLEFYTGVLGLRLVKKTVNQDDVRAYHLFYADAVATPGTDITFFEWPNVGPNQPGPGSVSATVFRVESADAVSTWEERLVQHGVTPERYENGLSFADHEGQALRIEVFAGQPNDSQPWTTLVPESSAIRGIGAIELPSIRPDATRAVLTELLGFTESTPGTFEVSSETTYGQVRLTTS
ncbi:MAG TPA: VOC family protein, partial [Fimbriimonadaceae bacterium]|nr:VOC family protein [Fimbriimonadaceae bacterium]